MLTWEVLGPGNPGLLVLLGRADVEEGERLGLEAGLDSGEIHFVFGRRSAGRNEQHESRYYSANLLTSPLIDTMLEHLRKLSDNKCVDDDTQRMIVLCVCKSFILLANVSLRRKYGFTFCSSESGKERRTRV